jgi:hypothetical protein
MSEGAEAAWSGALAATGSPTLTNPIERTEAGILGSTT